MELDIHTQRHIFLSAIIRLEELIFEFILWIALSRFPVHQAKHVAFAKELGCHVLSFPNSERNIDA